MQDNVRSSSGSLNTPGWEADSSKDRRRSVEDKPSEKWAPRPSAGGGGVDAPPPSSHRASKWKEDERSLPVRREPHNR